MEPIAVLWKRLDTPGHEDFSEDTYRTLTAVDSAIMVIDAAKGIEPQTRKLFEVCRLRSVPIITFVNKVDREGRPTFELLDEVADMLALDVSPQAWPVGMGGQFEGVLDFATGAVSRPEGPSKEFLGKRDTDAALPEAVAEEIELAQVGYPEFDLEAYRHGDLTPVYFGSALKNFGVAELIDAIARYAPPPRPQPAGEETISPERDEVTGFIFKVQANMDPQHRDRIAFMRMVSGTFKRGMKLKQTRTGKQLAIYNPVLFLAQDRELAEEAWAGDIIGIPNHGALHLGDSLTEGEELNFRGLPAFAPELLRKVRPLDPLKAKHLGRALQQLAQEGAARVFKPMIGADWIVGVVGALQFDVLADRIRTEYEVPVALEATQYYTARWVDADEAGTLKHFIDRNKGSLAEDHEGFPVFMARNAWHLQDAQDNAPTVRFLDTREPTSRV